jgi:large subunit ribosomal protein L1
MAKKQTAPPAEAEGKPAASAAAPAEEKAGKAEKAPKRDKADKADADKADKADKAEGSPSTPLVKGEDTGESSKRRGRKPGTPPRRGKKLRNQIRNIEQKLEKEGVVPLKRAVALLKQVKRAKFDETVEVHMSLGIDSTQSDQMIRGSVPLPHGVGKSVRVLVFCQGDNVAKAKEAGADYAGSDELIKKIQGEGWLEFDVALSTQDLMGQVSRLGKVLGPRGLMPTPKAGTVITTGSDVAAAVREFKAGKVEYRSDKGGNVHAGVGKMSFDDDKLAANITAFVDQIRLVKPSGVKGHYVQSITIAGTMTPGIPVTM